MKRGRVFVYATPRGVAVTFAPTGPYGSTYFVLTPWSEPYLFLPTGMRNVSAWPRKTRELP